MGLLRPKNFRARSGSLSPQITSWPCRWSKWASREPVAPVPRTKIRIGAKLYHSAAKRRSLRRSHLLCEKHLSRVEVQSQKPMSEEPEPREEHLFTLTEAERTRREIE